jgi:adenylate cyclase
MSPKLPQRTPVELERLPFVSIARPTPLESMRALLRSAGTSLLDGLQVNGFFARDAPTILLATDIKDFTGTVERLGDTVGQQLIRAHNELLRSCLKRHRGREVYHAGDGILAAFGSAGYALRCAIAIQRRLQEYNLAHPDAPLQVRMGLHAGQPLREENRLFGSCVNITVRVCAAAAAEHILATDLVLALAAPETFCFEDRGSFTLKGVSSRMRLHELGWQRNSTGALN